MRRLLITGVVAAATFVGMVLPASGSFVSEFSVITNTVQSHNTSDGFAFREEIFQIDNPNNRIGRDKGHCDFRPHNKAKCKVVVWLNGEVGGRGFLRISGNVGPGDSRLNVTAGTDDFAGAAGKAVLSGPNDTVVTVSLVQ